MCTKKRSLYGVMILSYLDSNASHIKDVTMYSDKIIAIEIWVIIVGLLSCELSTFLNMLWFTWYLKIVFHCELFYKTMFTLICTFRYLKVLQKIWNFISCVTKQILCLVVDWSFYHFVFICKSAFSYFQITQDCLDNPFECEHPFNYWQRLNQW